MTEAAESGPGAAPPEDPRVGEPPCMKVPVHQRGNRIHWFTGRAHQVLDDALAGGVRLLELSPTDIAEALEELTWLEARLDGIKLQLLAHAEDADVARELSATSTVAWLKAATRTSGSEAKKLVATARRIEAFEATSIAALEGRVNGAQAEVIVRRVDKLPDTVDEADRRRAEAHLIGLAAQFDAVTLDRLARHLHEVIDPEGAEEALARQLEKDEAAAARKTSLKLWDDGHGSCHGEFTIPSIHGDMLRVALDALASPKLPNPIAREVEEDGQTVVRALPKVWGEAFTQLLERFPTKKLPQTGGGLATVLVTIPVGLLEDGLGVATLSSGGKLTAGAARRLACQAGIIPRVVDSKSVILDQGRQVRLHTHSQRIAMASRDKTCTAIGCSIPASFCHAHHKKPWAKGGRTSVKDGTMLCPRHHRMVHDPRYETEYRTHGKTHITRTARRRH